MIRNIQVAVNKSQISNVWHLNVLGIDQVSCILFVKVYQMDILAVLVISFRLIQKILEEYLPGGDLVVQKLLIGFDTRFFPNLENIL
jgi:hypothetical protein